jgi:DNA repair protein RadD
MIELRPYQHEALNALYAYFATKAGHPLVVLPTGTGKSVVIAAFVANALHDFPDTRILIVTHVRELISQNFSEMVALWPECPAGIHSAGLGQRNLHAQVLFAGIQSIHRHAYDVQRADLVLIDEAHLIPRSANTMYGRFLADLRKINPHLKVIGLTATPYRLDSGLLHDGDDALFSDIAYDYPIGEAIAHGYLCGLIPKQTATQLDTQGVHTRGGEFIAGELERAVDKDTITKAAVAEIVALGRERHSWLCFCAGVDHAEHVAAEIRAHGFTCEAVTGDTPSARRDQLIADFKAGRLRALTNVAVLTTGFNHPGIDLIAMLRPTKSAGLYIQQAGRGTRLAPTKTNCLVLDFAGNVKRHGPIDKINPKRPGDGEGDAPVKLCPNCDTICFAGVRVCPDCGFEFPKPQALILPTASTDAILSNQRKAEWIRVDSVAYDRHTKPGKPPSLKVEYRCGLNAHREWVCFEHSGYARQKAVLWWQRRSPLPVPDTVAQALALTAQLPTPTEIAVMPDGRYTTITGVKFESQRIDYIKQFFLECLRREEKLGANLTNNKYSDNYAPIIFIRKYAFGKFTVSEVENAMNLLIEEDYIKLEEYKSNDRKTKKRLTIETANKQRELNALRDLPSPRPHAGLVEPTHQASETTLPGVFPSLSDSFA